MDEGFRACSLKGIAAALKVTIRWLETGFDGVSEAESLYNFEPAPDPKPAKVPVISWVQAGHACEVVDLYAPGDGEDWVSPTVHVKNHTYALRVQGDSMSPTFTEGMILVVEPEMEASPGDYVIAKNGDDEATFKKYVRDGGQEFLKPINPQYPMMPMGSYKIIGVVREAIMKFR